MTSEKPWWADMPIPKSQATIYKKENLVRQFAILQDVLNAGTLLVDVRRTDYEGGTIRSSLNLPAQSFYMNMATLWRLCQGDVTAGSMPTISRIMFYCGSSSGRGPRCAGWFKDYVAQRCANEDLQESPEVFVLEGGIKGWVAGGDQYLEYMDGYVPEYWEQFKVGALKASDPGDQTK